MRGSRHFRQGGGGKGPGPSDKKSSDIFLVLDLLLSMKTIIYKVPKGVQHFPGGGGSNFFQWGSNCLLTIATLLTCDFPGGGGPDPLPPLDPPMLCIPAEANVGGKSAKFILQKASMPA